MRERKKSIFTIANLVVALIVFAAFLVVGISCYYMAVGEFVTARLWVLYIALALVGAVGMFLHWYHFVGLYYAGCVLGWFSGRFIGGLKGEFAPQAGMIVTVALLGVFTVLGVILQTQVWKRRYERRREEKAAAKAQRAEKEKLEDQLIEAKKEKAAAQAALEAVANAERTTVPKSETGMPTADPRAEVVSEETASQEPLSDAADSTEQPKSSESTVR